MQMSFVAPAPLNTPLKNLKNRSGFHVCVVTSCFMLPLQIHPYKTLFVHLWSKYSELISPYKDFVKYYCTALPGIDCYAAVVSFIVLFCSILCLKKIVCAMFSVEFVRQFSIFCKCVTLNGFRVHSS